MGDAADDAERRANWEREEYGDGRGLRAMTEREDLRPLLYFATDELARRARAALSSEGQPRCGCPRRIEDGSVIADIAQWTDCEQHGQPRETQESDARAAEPRPKVCKCESCRCEKGDGDVG